LRRKRMFEKILVPLDGSKIGEAALPAVIELVSKLSPQVKVEIALLMVITATTYWVVAGEASAPVRYSEQELKLIEKEGQAYLDKKAEALRSHGATVQTILVRGTAAAEIIKTAEKTNVGLIAMSTHGRTGLGRWAFGSVTDKVLHASPVPVLTVRATQSTANA